MRETFTETESIIFLFEYMPGLDLYHIIQNELKVKLGNSYEAGKPNKDWVKFYAAEVIVALEMLHSNNIIYRDLKPDNIVVDNEGHIKLIDFGFAKSLNSQNNYRTFTNCGTLGYTSPEILLNVN